MSSIQQIVTVTANTGSSTRRTQPFGYPMIFANFSGGSQLAAYSSIAEVGAVHNVGTAPYIMADVMFGQQNAPSRIYIGRRSTEVAQVVTLTLSADLVSGNTFAATVNGSSISVLYASSHSATLSAIAAAIEALGSVLTCVADAGPRTLVITGDLADTTYGGAVTVTGETITGGASQATITETATTALVNAVTDLNTLANDLGSSADWYAFCTDLRTDSRIQLISSWAASNKRLFAWQSDTAAILDPDSTNDVGYAISAAGDDWSVGLYYGDDTKYKDAAWLASKISADLDNISTTWVYQRLAGSGSYSNLTTAQEAALAAKDVNYYSQLETGAGGTQPGVTGSGRFIDERVGLDWLKRRSEEVLAAALVDASNRQSKIPHTPSGRSLLAGVALGVLQKGVRTGFLTDEPLENADGSVTDRKPRVEVVTPSSADLTARRVSLNGFGYLAGAIHEIQLYAITLEV